MKREPEDNEELKEDNLPFSVPINAQLFGYYQWCEAKRRIKKPQNKSVIKRISKVSPIIKKDIEVTVIGPTAITDIDAGYFTDIVGRPIKEKFSRHRYIEQIRKVLRAKLFIGYNRDNCMRIDQQFIEEKKRLASIQRQFRYHNNAFEEYLSTDHEVSMKILDDARREVKKSNDLIAKRDELLNKFGQVRLEIYQWEEMWRTVKMCNEFFRKITSITSQLTIRKSLTPEKNDESSERTSNLGTMECLIEAFEKNISDDCFGCEEISIEDPHELSRIFAAIEQRNLDALIHLESLAGPVAKITASIVIAEELIGDEIKFIEENLNELESLIHVSEQRATELQTYADYLLHEVFRELVCSDSVLHLRVFIEDTYESCVGPNDANLDSYSMMRVIEKTYESLNMTLDSLPRAIVHICEREGFAQEMRTMREAEDAARKFGLMHRLLIALERIMKPLPSNSNPKLKDKSVENSGEKKLISSAPNSTVTIKQKKSLKSNISLKKSNFFLNENCQSTDLNIFNELTAETKNLIKDENLTQASSQNDNKEDCRNKISKI